ncbi:Do family serine endopeptidase [Parabacteroides sp. 52]|uniref:Do family serine endopeptidase n=1 Tax=unclassified Parabacteroides TaxID=2649774 RepID=UPI0013D5A58A|nr:MULTISPECIES: Do family serine endopeptidase [unclassified Parabacteroides]MDH6533511.1 serine protease Do [Parabacteroides sp. PM5-20]NDV54264.1 Do family serine endopeptidase [Parabacteroides sp. 52]
MKKVWKNMLGVVAVSAISVGLAVGTSSYLIQKKLSESSYSVETEYGFKQPSFHLANYNAVAAENIDFTVAAEKAVHAVVHIKATTNTQMRRGNQQYIDPFEFFFGFGNRGYQPQPQPRVGAGSGVIISVDGYIMTNNHVIDGADELEVTLNDNRKFSAKIVGADPQTDIALLKIDAKDLATIPFGNSDDLKVGEWVLAIGNPFNLTSTVTAGIVSAKGRGGISRGGGIESFIQTDAAVNPGNSGGALVNTKGELVGINTAIYSETGNFAGYSFAVPIGIAGKVAGDLKQYGAVQRAILGVLMQDILTIQDQEVKNKLKVTEGAYISEFAQQSAAKQAGMEIGDVIVAVNDAKIKSANALQEQISKYRPGDKVKVTVDRYGTNKTFVVELRNNQGNTEVVKTTGSASEVLGAAFKALSDKRKQELGLSYGIEVTGLTNGKLKEVGIPKGFIIQVVNEQPVSTPEEFEQIVEKLLKSNEDKVLFIKGYMPSGRARYYAIDLTE